MGRVMNVRVRSASVAFRNHAFATPMVLSTGVIREVTEAIAEVRVDVDGREGVGRGRGSVLLSDLWAWPDPTVPHERRDRTMRDLAESVAARLDDWVGGEAAHPL